MRRCLACQWLVSRCYWLLQLHFAAALEQPGPARHHDAFTANHEAVQFVISPPGYCEDGQPLRTAMSMPVLHLIDSGESMLASALCLRLVRECLDIDERVIAHVNSGAPRVSCTIMTKMALAGQVESVATARSL